MRIRNSESGAVLVVVLGILALLTVMAVSFVFMTRMSLRSSEAYMRTLTASDIAEAGMANAIYMLQTDKIKRTGDPKNPLVTPTETYDSLYDIWRQNSSAPVIIKYTETTESISPGDTVTNYTDDPTVPPYQSRYLARAKVIAIDTTNSATDPNDNGRLYLDSPSTALWQAGDHLVSQNATGTFDVTVENSTKPDTVDLDGDGTPDAVWQNYYDENGVLAGRYAVLIEDESSKINVNVSGNIAKVVGAGKIYDVTDNTTYNQWANEGWSTYEIDMAKGLNTSTSNARQMVFYRNGIPVGSPDPLANPWDIDNSPASPPGNRESVNRVAVPGQGDLTVTLGDSKTYDDDDDNYNRYFYARDGIDNDSDGIIDEVDEGINEPEEFRPLKPVRLRPEVFISGELPLDADGLDNNHNGVVDETDEGDDQPLLTLEQLDDSQGAAVPGSAPYIFTRTPVSTNFDGVTNTSRERRHFMSTLSNDKNLNQNGRLRINPNFATQGQEVGGVHAAFPATSTGDTDPFELHDLRNMQVAANIYDYRDRDRSRSEVQDTEGDTFAGVEAIRINEVMVRAATSVYEAEWQVGAWTTRGTATAYLQGAKSPLPLSSPPPYAQNCLTNLGLGFAAPLDSGIFNIVLPDPPFSNASPAYYFRLRMRVRSSGAGAVNDRGFEVWVNGTKYPSSTNPAYSIFGPKTSRCALWNQGTTLANWYEEEIVLPLNGNGANNQLFFRKPTAAAQPDIIDIDWFYFSQEPDCEWIELVNLGNSNVSVKDWTIVSEYIKDISLTDNLLAWPSPAPPPPPVYYRETVQATLPNVGIAPVNATIAPYAELPSPPPPPQYIVFAVDRNDTAGSLATISNQISFMNTWTNIATSLAAANVYQIASSADIYSRFVDFFGNKPLDDVSDTNGPILVAPNRNVYQNVDVAKISLYDSHGNLVDRVTYDWGQVKEGFRSLQRDHPANPGDRLVFDSTPPQQYFFKMRSYTGTASEPMADYNVNADGNYDDWQWPWLDAAPGSSDPNYYRWIGWSTPTGANNRSAGAYADYSDMQRRVATPDCRVKDHSFASVGELAKMPFYNEYVAIIEYQETSTNEDEKLAAELNKGNHPTISNTTNAQDAILLSVHPQPEPSGETHGWMVVRGDKDHPVNNDLVDVNGVQRYGWKKNQTIQYTSASISFNATILSVKPADTLMADSLQFYAKLTYPDTANDSDLAQGQTITNTTKTETATAMDVDKDRKFLIVQGDVANPVNTWAPRDAINNSPGAFSATVSAVDEAFKEANVRKLADYFSTAFIDLEAAAAEIYAANLPDWDVPSQWPASWPGSSDPKVFLVLPPNPPSFAGDNFRLGWNEDDGVQEGTYDLYAFVNYGAGISSETPIYVGPVTAQKDPATQKFYVTMDIKNMDSAAAQYHFMRAVLAPPPMTFGRININTASGQVLQGLRLEYPDRTDPSKAATYIPKRGDGTDITRDDFAKAIIKARNIKAFESIGDLYRASEQLIGDVYDPLNPPHYPSKFFYGFTPDVFKNISNLVTTRSDYYKIIVLGQGANDANNDGIIEDNEVMSEKKIELIYQR